MREIMYREAIREAIVEEMKKDKYLFLIGEDIGKYGGEFRVSGDMVNIFGVDRVRDAPISEQGQIGLGIGASVTGCRAIVEIPFCDFMPMCADQIVNQAAKFYYMFGGQANVPMVIRTAIGGFIGGSEQHSQCLESWFTNVPGLKAVIPSTPYDAKGLLKTAINDPNPVIVFENKYLYPVKGPVPEEEYTIPLGVADVKREGKDITVIATSLMVWKSLEVAEKLAKEGISVEVVDPRSLVPLDKETILNSVKKTGKVVIVNEAPVQGSTSGEFAAIIADEGFEYLEAPIKRVGAKWAPIPNPSVLEDYVLPRNDDIEKAIRQLL